MLLTKKIIICASEPRYNKLNLTLVKSTVNFAIFLSNCLATLWRNKLQKQVLRRGLTLNTSAWEFSLRFQTKCADGIKCENDYGNEMAIARQGKQLNYLATAPQHYGLLSGGFLSVANLFLALKQGAAGTPLLGVVWSVHFVLQSEDPVASLCVFPLVLHL